MAWYALEDPKKELEKEIAYKERVAEIMRERAERDASDSDE
jgi:hypothetical protein